MTVKRYYNIFTVKLVMCPASLKLFKYVFKTNEDIIYDCINTQYCVIYNNIHELFIHQLLTNTLTNLMCCKSFVVYILLVNANRGL